MSIKIIYILYSIVYSLYFMFVLRSRLNYRTDSLENWHEYNRDAGLEHMLVISP